MWYLWPLQTPEQQKSWHTCEDLPYHIFKLERMIFLALIFTLVSSTKLAYFNIRQSVWTLSEAPRAVIRSKRWGLVQERDQQCYQKHKTQTYSLFPPSVKEWDRVKAQNSSNPNYSVYVSHLLRLEKKNSEIPEYSKNCNNLLWWWVVAPHITITGNLLHVEESKNRVLNIELGPTRVIIYLKWTTQIQQLHVEGDKETFPIRQTVEWFKTLHISQTLETQHSHIQRSHFCPAKSPSWTML